MVLARSNVTNQFSPPPADTLPRTVSTELSTLESSRTVITPVLSLCTRTATCANEFRDLMPDTIFWKVLFASEMLLPDMLPLQSMQNTTASDGLDASFKSFMHRSC